MTARFTIRALIRGLRSQPPMPLRLVFSSQQVGIAPTYSSGAVLTRASAHWGMASFITRLPACGGKAQRLTPRPHDLAQPLYGQAENSSCGAARMRTETRLGPEQNPTPPPTSGQR